MNYHTDMTTQVMALDGPVDKMLLKCELSQKPDLDWHEPLMLRLQTVTYYPLCHLPPLMITEPNAGCHGYRYTQLIYFRQLTENM